MMTSGGGMTSTSGAAHSGGGLMGGVASTAGATAGTVMNTAGSAPGECWRKSRCGNTFHLGRGRIDLHGPSLFEQQRRVWPRGASRSKLRSLQRDARLSDCFLHEKRSPGKRHTDASVRCRSGSLRIKSDEGLSRHPVPLAGRDATFVLTHPVGSSHESRVASSPGMNSVQSES